MNDKIRVRVSTDGKYPQWELMVNEMKICDLSYSELLEHCLQATSSLRWITEALPKK